MIYEAPGRVAATLGDLASACGSERPAAVCRELTKLHEDVVRGTLGALAAIARGGGLTIRGEFALVIGEWREAGIADGSVAGRQGSIEDREAVARAAVERLVSEGTARGDAARRIASETGIPRRRLYIAPPTEG